MSRPFFAKRCSCSWECLPNPHHQPRRKRRQHNSDDRNHAPVVALPPRQLARSFALGGVEIVLSALAHSTPVASEASMIGNDFDNGICADLNRSRKRAVQGYDDKKLRKYQNRKVAQS